MHPTPLTSLFHRAEALWLPYGPSASPIMLAGAFDHVDLEYAAIRKACALLDQPTRGMLVITGNDRIPFLNRMVTQELKSWPDYTGVRSFWLSRKGRIDADLRLINIPATPSAPARVIVDCDAFAVDRARAGLEAYIIADDVQIADATHTLHRLALHGPGAPAILARFSTHAAGTPVQSLQPGQACIVAINNAEVIVDRWDSTGEVGLELAVPAAHAQEIYETLLQAAHAPEVTASLNPKVHLRPIGWHAYNVARIEAGTPLYMVDFGPDALPAETGVLADRVSFRKGCYLGQEVVARMHALGHPKQMVVSLRLHEAPRPDGQPMRQPQAGAPVYAENPASGEQPVGAVSSSTTSPMLGGEAIALGTVKFKHASPGTKLAVLADGTTLLPARVQPTLASWTRG